MPSHDLMSGRTPLVPLVGDDEFPPDYRVVVERIKSRSGGISNSARATAHGAALAASARAFLESTWLLGDLPKPFRALIRYKVSTVNTCLYCSSHQIAYLRKMGVDGDKIAHIHDFEAHPAFDARERAALAFVEAMTVDASNVPDAVAERFVATFTPKERIEIAIVAAGMDMLNKLNDALRVPVEESALDIAAVVPPLRRGRAAG